MDHANLPENVKHEILSYYHPRAAPNDLSLPYQIPCYISPEPMTQNDIDNPLSNTYWIPRNGTNTFTRIADDEDGGKRWAAYTMRALGQLEHGFLRSRFFDTLGKRWSGEYTPPPNAEPMMPPSGIPIVRVSFERFKDTPVQPELYNLPDERLVEIRQWEQEACSITNIFTIPLQGQFENLTPRKRVWLTRFHPVIKEMFAELIQRNTYQELLRLKNASFPRPLIKIKLKISHWKRLPSNYVGIEEPSYGPSMDPPDRDPTKRGGLSSGQLAALWQSRKRKRRRTKRKSKRSRIRKKN